MTLNLLRGSRINQSLSAYAQINGLLDFTKTPLAPPGIRALVHETPGQRNSWALHAQPGWYVGPAMGHYPCYTVHITKTKSMRFTDTLAWFPSKVVMYIPTSTDRAIAAANDLTIALSNPSSVSQLLPMDDTTRSYLKKLSRLFGNHIIKGTYIRLLKSNSRVQFPLIPRLQPLLRNAIHSTQPPTPLCLSPPL